MSDYILKTEIPVCPKLPDMSKYILKSTLSTGADNQSKPKKEKNSNKKENKTTDTKKNEMKNKKNQNIKKTEKVTQQIKIVKKIKSSKPEEVKITVKNRAKPPQSNAQSENNMLLENYLYLKRRKN